MRKLTEAHTNGYLTYYGLDYTHPETGETKSYGFVSRSGNKNVLSNPESYRHPVENGVAKLNSNLFDAVKVLIFNTETKEVLTIQEYRPAIDGYLIDIPSGLVDEGETVYEAGAREVLEETGVVVSPDDLFAVGGGFTSAGLSDERVAILATFVNGVSQTEQDLQGEEAITSTWVDSELASDLTAFFVDTSISTSILLQLHAHGLLEQFLEKEKR